MRPESSSQVARAAKPSATSANITRPAYHTLCGQMSGVAHGVCAVLRYSRLSLSTPNDTAMNSTAAAASSTIEIQFIIAFMRRGNIS